jgi:hypothetical protein
MLYVNDIQFFQHAILGKFELFLGKKWQVGLSTYWDAGQEF